MIGNTFNPQGIGATQPAPVQAPTLDYSFTMDQDSYRVLVNIPAMYHNFIINLGIKLASEQSLINKYIKDFTPEVVAEIKTVASPTTGGVGVNGSLATASGSSQPTPNKAVAGFQNW
jgi:hypothetical protein